MCRESAALTRFGRVLADPTRVQLLALRDAPGYPAQLAELLGVTRQNLSNHLTVLRSSGLVVSVPEGRRSRYRLAVPAAADAVAGVAGHPSPGSRSGSVDEQSPGPVIV